MVSLRTARKDEHFKLEVGLLLNAHDVAEMLNASFDTPEIKRENARVTNQLLNAVRKKLAEQGVDFSDDMWAFERLKARPRPGYCTYGLVFIYVSLTASRL